MKADTTGIEELFIETPVKKNGRPVQNIKPTKQPQNGLEGVSSWQMGKEVFKRHHINLQIVGFWLILAVVIWQKLR